MTYRVQAPGVVGRALAIATALIALTALPNVGHTANAPTPVAATISAPIQTIGLGGSTVQVTLQAPLGLRSLTVPDAAARATLSHAEKGDILKAEIDDAANPTQVIKLNEVDRPIDAWTRIVALALSAIFFGLLTAVVTRGRPQAFLIGTDNRYSNSQCQLMLWFGAVAIVYLASVALRILWLGGDFVGGVGLTTNVIAMTGLSALSFGGAKVITAQKVANAAAAPPPPPPVPAAAPGAPAAAAPAANPAPAVKTAAVKPNLLTDLVQDDSGHADLGDFEMILITLAAVGIFVLTSFHFLGGLRLENPTILPDVDTALLSSFGLGQGAYLIKKAAMPLGQG
jgi:hypothetical protein